jgi:signal transduction histidine kinase
MGYIIGMVRRVNGENGSNRPKVSNGISDFDGGAEEPRFGKKSTSDPEQRFRALALEALENEQLERGRLARALHDEVAQVLSGAGLQLDILRMDLEDRIPEIASRTAEIQEMLERVVLRIRDLSYQLNPDIVKRAGLQPALDLLVARYRRVFPGSLQFVYDSSVQIPAEVGVAMERVADEAVANAVRHANCDQIEIIVESTGDGAALLVRDNGAGFDHERERRAPRGLGLLMMDHCARKAGLRLTFNGHDGAGSVVNVSAAGQRGDSRKRRGGNAM